MDYIAYYRVSTKRQAKSDLGIQAQKTAVRDLMKSSKSKVMHSFTEVESGKKNNRPELMKALELCKKHKCKLVVAKLDRLSRDLEFIVKLQKSEIGFVCCDVPEANELTISLLAVIAQHERRMISNRTKAALAEAKKKGVKLGNIKNLQKGRNDLKKQADEFAKRIYDTIEPIRSRGDTQQEIVDWLNKSNIKTAREGSWSRMQLYRVIQRVEAA
jgi:DNA invertase Pin-like site-specific DNA recombinase